MNLYKYTLNIILSCGYFNCLLSLIRQLMEFIYMQLKMLKLGGVLERKSKGS